MKKEPNIQVDKEHYYNNYDTLGRFISYYYQARFAQKLNPKKILEIGVGNKTVSNYLSQNGYKVMTYDFDKELNPDFVGDIRDIKLVKDNSFDLVMACEILEHIPFEDVTLALDEINRISKKHVIISIPYSAFSFQAILAMPFLHGIMNRTFVKFPITIPFFFYKPKFDGQHYWEGGMRGYSLRKIKKLLKKNFKILKQERPVLHPYHQFFVLEKKAKA
jgi:ubiquinone/menaquinone biosynthesis C-methylase UbiE